MRLRNPIGRRHRGEGRRLVEMQKIKESGARTDSGLAGTTGVDWRRSGVIGSVFDPQLSLPRFRDSDDFSRRHVGAHGARP